MSEQTTVTTVIYVPYWTADANGNVTSSWCAWPPVSVSEDVLDVGLLSDTPEAGVAPVV